MKLCLNCIVKNESARIERMLDSVCQFIDYWVIVDTGSTDDTKEKIKAYFEYHHVPGELHEAPFENWSQARNAALAFARTAWCNDASAFDYLLFVDADMQLVVKDREKFLALTAPVYEMEQRGGAVHYMNVRLLAAAHYGKYVGVTHEYFDGGQPATLSPDVAFFLDHADGANRPEKYKRDIRLLKEGLRQEPTNARYMFYLANSYRDAGQHDHAIKWYERRVAAGGWDEEVWQAQVYAAHCYKECGNEPRFIRDLLTAFNMRPTRAEPLYDLANYFRLKGQNPAGAVFAEAALSIPKPNDVLFVNDYVYQGGVQQEFSITGFYLPSKRQAAFEATDKMIMFPGPYGDTYHTARRNMYHYLPSLKDLCPSFNWKRIDFEPPAGWTAMNPSVALQEGCLTCIVRTVNYTITENGRYVIKEVHDDGSTGCNANAENPINTRNWALSLTDSLSSISAEEVLPPGNFPKEWPLVVGFEDMRLIPYKDDLWFSATVRQLHADGNCEQVLGRIDVTAEDLRVADDYVRMLRTPRQTEKNWAPVVMKSYPYGPGIKFIHRPGEVVDCTGATIDKSPVNFHAGSISGGSQLVEFDGEFIALVHEAAVMPFEPHARFYWHRFIRYDVHLRPLGISTPFVLNDKVIEFVAGMCWHPDNKRLVISYGYKDAEARIATVSADEVRKLLCLAAPK